MLPVAQREAQFTPAIPPVEPSIRFAARVASGIFAGQALILFVIGVLPDMSGAYLVVLLVSSPHDVVAGSWLTLVGVIFPAAALLRAVRDAVTGLVRSLAEAARTDTLTGHKNRRVGDSVARTGGEEFTILLPGASEHEAYLVAERLRAQVERDFADHPVPVTFSFGVATYPEHGRNADAVIEAADQALYAAKALGRNRSVIFNREISAVFAPEPGGRGVDETHLATLLSLAEALDLRDAGTAAHSRTVGRYCGLIAKELELPAERAKRIEVAGVLHDIGKIGLPDAILQKPGRLGRAELAEIRTHPEIGAQVLSGRGLEDLRAWVLAHHERPDGKGYPTGLSDRDIPLEAKILAVADAFEAMTADRVYREGMGAKAARSELLRCAGTQFDSRVVAAFMAVLERFEREPGHTHAGEAA